MANKVIIEWTPEMVMLKALNERLVNIRLEREALAQQKYSKSYEFMNRTNERIEIEKIIKSIEKAGA